MGGVAVGAPRLAPIPAERPSVGTEQVALFDLGLVDSAGPVGAFGNVESVGRAIDFTEEAGLAVVLAGDDRKTILAAVKDECRAYPGEHKPIIGHTLWDNVHAILQESPRRRASNTRAQTPALLKGLIFGPDGAAFSPTHTKKGDKLYRYYVSQSVLKRGADACPIARVPAAEVEIAVIDQLRGLLRAPEIIIGTWRAARTEIENLPETDVREALERLDPIWEELFPAEQARIVQLLVERVDLSTDGLAIRLRTQGLASLVADLAAIRADQNTTDSRKAA